VNRANKAEHMAAPHRYLRREDFPCQFGAVHTWPFCDFDGSIDEDGFKPSCGLVLKYFGGGLWTEAKVILGQSVRLWHWNG
jgi:hypothetical protein